jgi:hypothetical protein
MGLKKTLVAGLAAAALSLPSVATAGIDFIFNWGATGEGGFGGTTTSLPVREMKFTAESVIVFNGVPFSTGTTFTDYVVLRIDQLFNSGGNPVGPYGDTGVPNVFNMGITILAQFTGVQTNAPAGQNNYIINGLTSFKMFYDGPNGGYTAADFANLATFIDGIQVETANGVSGVGTNAVNAPDGNLDLFISLVDLLGFEALPDGSLTDFISFTNSNNHLCGTPQQTCASSRAAILAAFGQGDTFGFHTKSDGSIEKLASIPEPDTLGLLGLALAAMGFVALRRRKA